MINWCNRGSNLKNESNRNLSGLSGEEVRYTGVALGVSCKLDQ